MQSTSGKDSSNQVDFVDDFFIFGYGSLIWNPGFEHNGNPIVGFTCGYSRKFYQASENYRGTTEWPGRVATLVPETNAKTWGIAYRVTHPESVVRTLEHLFEREMVKGEYQNIKVNFHPCWLANKIPGNQLNLVSSTCSCFDESGMICAMTYVANVTNSLYVGQAPIESECHQILLAAGIAGSNIEYVEKIAQFYVDHVPNGLDEDSYLKDIIHHLQILKTENYDMLNYSGKIGDNKFNEK